MNTHTFFIILISVSLALGIYGVVVQRGANLVRFDGRTAAMASIWAVLELIASLAGYGIGRWILRFEMERDRSPFWIHVLAGAIFAAIGIRMLFLAFRKKTFLEHRMEEVDIRADVLLALHLCVHGFFAGIACGILCLRLPLLVGAVFIISAAFAVGGYITGRNWGVEPSDKAYALGGGMLCLLGIALQLLPL
ncbi:MAG: hypothetical protein E7238_07190 [Sarcina sp.]|nr:hypothetical protein [Sarcina sp.]